MIKRILFQLTLVAILLVLLTPSSLILAKERRISLVIGNGAYRSAPLRNPVNDAKDIADALRNLGFTVILKTNADQRTMEATIREFGEKLRLGGVGLFYFAGHGLQVNGRNYLMPIGADVETESEIKYETVDAGRVLGQMEDAGNGFNIIILDACRDNPFGRSFRTSEKGLVKMDAPTGSFLAYSTAPGSVAADGTGRNGLYTSMLLKHITTPGLELEKLFKYVRIEVASASGNKQVPWESSSLMGDFYFNTKRGIAVKSRPSYTGLEAERKQLELKRKEIERVKSEAAERKRNEAERERIEAVVEKMLKEESMLKRKEIERLKIEVEKKKLEDERLKIKKESLKMASIPQNIHVDRVSLRTEPMKAMSELNIKSMLANYGFFDSSKNISGSFDNYFVDNNDGTVTDKATMLMWEKSGSIRSKDYDRANAYIKQLKKERFAGYSDWRLPTLEELASLLEKGEQKGVHIDSVFNNKQIRCWTDDRSDRNYIDGTLGIGETPPVAWIVDFQQGRIYNAVWLTDTSYSIFPKNYIKAVRSAK